MLLPVTYERGVPHPLPGCVDTGTLGVASALRLATDLPKRIAVATDP